MIEYLEWLPKAMKTLRSIRSRLQPIRGSHELIKVTLEAIKKSESQANVIWVVTPRLHYDVEDAKFSLVVNSNVTSHGKKYRYLLSMNEKSARNLVAYKEKYRRTPEEMAKDFQKVEGNVLDDFMFEVVLHDPGTERARAFLYPPSRPRALLCAWKADEELYSRLATSFRDKWKDLTGELP